MSELLPSHACYLFLRHTYEITSAAFEHMAAPPCTIVKVLRCFLSICKVSFSIFLINSDIPPCIIINLRWFKEPYANNYLIICLSTCDTRGFWLTLIVSQLCRQWSNHGQPMSSPWKPHQPTLMTLLIKSTHPCSQPLVKVLVKPT
jgi:hypothetical protein